jgi:transcription-repair coupling factor (superfamily II helicase)
VPDVHQRLVLYKRFSSAGSPDEVSDLRSELVDRFGELPDELDTLTELTLLKLQMRELRLRALESGPSRLVVTLGPDALLDGAKLAALVQKGKGIYRLTPDLKLIARREGPDQAGALLSESRKIIRDLSACAAQ